MGMEMSWSISSFPELLEGNVTARPRCTSEDRLGRAAPDNAVDLVVIDEK